jgi:FtsH-binding integral membrane protein
MYDENTYEQGYVPVIAVAEERRRQFLARTYQHLLVAIIAFATIEIILFKTGAADGIMGALTGVSWLLVLGGFMVVGWMFSAMAARAVSKPTQYLALAGYVMAEAIIFVPMLYIAEATVPGAIQSAALATILAFSGLTAVVMFTGKDFSFLGSFLKFAGIAALVAIVCGVVFGFHLGTGFSILMVLFAGGAILFDTSAVMRTYPEDRYVSAALTLFASVALMFWYLLRLFGSDD